MPPKRHNKNPIVGFLLIIGFILLASGCSFLKTIEPVGCLKDPVPEQQIGRRYAGNGYYCSSGCDLINTTPGVKNDSCASSVPERILVGSGPALVGVGAAMIGLSFFIAIL
jgi:hypothetical protein